MPVVKYDRPLGQGARKRHYHKTESGKVIDFMVQLEVQVGGKWTEVIRYDRTHNFAHMDRYNLEGKRKKDDLELNYEQALTLADTDINDNWEKYQQRFLKGGVAMNKFEWKNGILGKEFDQYVREHSEFAEKIPHGSVIALQVMGDEQFNRWSRKLAQEQAEEGQVIICVNIKRIRETRSRIEELELAEVIRS